MPGIDLTAGLAQWGVLDTYRTYLEKFVADYAGAGVAIATGAGQGDRAAAAALAHKLIGVAGTLALPRVLDLARQLDTQLKGDASIDALAAQLQEAIDEVCTGISGWMSGPDPAPAGSAVRTGDRAAGTVAGMMIEADTSRAAVAALLDQFLRALRQNDPDGCESLLAQLQGLVAPAPLVGIASRLTEFDFRGAEVLTHALLRDLTQ